MRTVNEVLDLVLANMKRGRYSPLSKDDSELIRSYWMTQVPFPPHETPLLNRGGTVLATNYERMVVGDYGAYLELAPEHVTLENLKLRWPGKPKRPVKYLWWQSKDTTQTKVYEQRGTVAYADYKVGMWYINPHDLHWE